jgi:tRNA(Ile2)-agmatinylcytidine synthase
MRLGVDDTDAPGGGCTTFVLTELVALGRSHGLDLLGEPRLVRLNPNVPWKTRGNAALSVDLGHGVGKRRTVGRIGGRSVGAYPQGRAPTVSETDRFREAAWSLVLELSEEAEGTDPAFVVADRPPSRALYERAVGGLCEPGEVAHALDRAGIWWRTYRSDRGIVGAAAAAAWPGRRRTWELISYREPGASGPRRVDLESVRAAARREPHLFLCDDPLTRRLLVAPHTPCPILFGLRSTTPEGALRARRWVRSEPVDRWLLCRTNQATGDHLRYATVGVGGPFRPARFRATVESPPRTVRGGHVDVRLRHEGEFVDCRVFEPTKTLPRVAASLRPGDSVEVWGGTGGDPTFRVEGFRILGLVPRLAPGAAPRCGSCGRRARSLGAARGYRCPGCHRRWPPESARARRVPAKFGRGTYHPTPSARRHLAPLGPEPGRRPAA